jgi:hypothetical protein
MLLIEWIYFNGNIENPERIKEVNGEFEVDYSNNTFQVILVKTSVSIKLIVNYVLLCIWQ